MTARRRAVVEALLAAAALMGAAVSVANVRSVVAVAPVTEGEPATTSLQYHAPPLVLALLLTTVAGVLLVVGAARWRRSHTHTP